jgi:hypothetical protein
MSVFLKTLTHSDVSQVKRDTTKKSVYPNQLAGRSYYIMKVKFVPLMSSQEAELMIAPEPLITLLTGYDILMTLLTR